MTIEEINALNMQMNLFLLRYEAVHFNCCVACHITPNYPTLPVFKCQAAQKV